jgi:hypothetical protein
MGDPQLLADAIVQRDWVRNALGGDLVYGVVTTTPTPDGWTSGTYTDGNSVVQGPVFIHYGADVRDGMEQVRQQLGRERTWDGAIQEIQNFGRHERGWAPMSTAVTLSGASNGTTTITFPVLSAGTYAIEQLNDTQWAAWVADQARSERDRALLERARTEHVTREEAARRADAERSAAEETARQLLHSMLSETDKRMLAAHGYFEVRGGKSGTRYRIVAGHHGTRNVLELDRHGHPRRRLCAHPFGVPDGDVLLAQKLVIETNEDLFLATANVSEP